MLSFINLSIAFYDQNYFKMVYTRKFLNDNQELEMAENALEKLSEITTLSESIEYIAFQKEAIHNSIPDFIAITNQRIIFFQPKKNQLLLEFKDFPWEDIRDCKIKENATGGVFRVYLKSNICYCINHLQKRQANLLYQHSQKWKEKFSNYISPEKSPKESDSLNSNVINNTIYGMKKSAGNKEDFIESLKKLKELLDNKLISQQEYDAKKEEVLSRL